MPADTAHTHIAPTDVALDDLLDALVLKASLGDHRAIGALAVGLGPTLLKEAREAVGARRAEEHEDLLQDLFVCLSHGKLPFVRGRDHGLEWLRAQLRSLAHASPTDRLVARAVDADPDAVEQIMIEHGDMLLEEARATLGAHGRVEAEQVVKDLEEELLEGAVSCERGQEGGDRVSQAEDPGDGQEQEATAGGRRGAGGARGRRRRRRRRGVAAADGEVTLVYDASDLITSSIGVFPCTRRSPFVAEARKSLASWQSKR